MRTGPTCPTAPTSSGSGHTSSRSSASRPAASPGRGCHVDEGPLAVTVPKTLPERYGLTDYATTYRANQA